MNDTEKFLQIFSTFRNLKVEGEMPPAVIYGAYSAFIEKYREAPG